MAQASSSTVAGTTQMVIFGFLDEYNPTNELFGNTRTINTPRTALGNGVSLEILEGVPYLTNMGTKTITLGVKEIKLGRKSTIKLGQMCIFNLENHQYRWRTKAEPKATPKRRAQTIMPQHGHPAGAVGHRRSLRLSVPPQRKPAARKRAPLTKRRVYLEDSAILVPPTDPSVSSIETTN